MVTTFPYILFVVIIVLTTWLMWHIFVNVLVINNTEMPEKANKYGCIKSAKVCCLIKPRFNGFCALLSVHSVFSHASGIALRMGILVSPVQHFGPGCNISTTIGWFTMKFCEEIGPQRMKLPDFCDSSDNHLIDFFLSVKCLENYWVDCLYSWYRYPWCPVDESY